MREFPSPIAGRIFGINWCKEIAPIYAVFFYNVLREREREIEFICHISETTNTYTQIQTIAGCQKRKQNHRCWPPIR